MCISVLCQIYFAHKIFIFISITQQEVVNFSEYLNTVKQFSTFLVTFIMILVVVFPVFSHGLS